MSPLDVPGDLPSTPQVTRLGRCLRPVVAPSVGGMNASEMHTPHTAASGQEPALRPRPVAATSPQGPGGAAAPHRSLNWLLILGLGLTALVRPLTNTVLDQLGIDPGPLVPLGWTALISLLWIAAVGLTRTASPVLTLVLVGLVYGLSAIMLSGILSTLLLGQLHGPLTTPIGLVAVLITNALWGLVTGAIALALQRARGIGPREAGDR